MATMIISFGGDTTTLKSYYIAAKKNYERLGLKLGELRETTIVFAVNNNQTDVFLFVFQDSSGGFLVYQNPESEEIDDYDKEFCKGLMQVIGIKPDTPDQPITDQDKAAAFLDVNKDEIEELLAKPADDSFSLLEYINSVNKKGNNTNRPKIPSKEKHNVTKKSAKPTYYERKASGFHSSVGGVRVLGGTLPNICSIGSVQLRYDGKITPRSVGNRGKKKIVKTDGNLQVFYRDESEIENMEFVALSVDKYRR